MGQARASLHPEALPLSTAPPRPRPPPPCDRRQIVRQIDLWGVDMLFVVGGNGGNAGAAAIQAELEKCDIVCSVVGVPKSIDNDILLVNG